MNWFGIMILWFIAIITAVFPLLLIFTLPIFIGVLFSGDYNEGHWKSGLGYW